MSQAHRQSVPESRKTARNALAIYRAELEEFYPEAKDSAQIVTRPDGRTIVNITLPKRASERMRLFDHIGTRLLLETDQYIILSSR